MQRAAETRRLVDLEVNRRVEEAVKARLAIELARSDELIELEVQKRLTQAKIGLEKQMLEEFERLKQVEYKRQLEKEVRNRMCASYRLTSSLLLHYHFQSNTTLLSGPISLSLLVHY